MTENALYYALSTIAQVAAEVRRQQATTGEQRAEVQRELDLINTVPAKCDREEQRWREAYAGEVISLEELKRYRADIDVRRQSVLTQRAALQTTLDAIGQAVGQVGALIDYCERVRQRLQTFDSTEKRRVLAALDILVTWIPGAPLAIQGCIPFSDIVSSSPG